MSQHSLSLIGQMVRAARETTAIFEQHLTEAGLAPLTARQAVLMLALERHPGISQTNLAAQTGMDRSSLSEMVRRMQERQLLTRTRVDDGRIMQLQLTKQGTDMLVVIKRAERAAMASISKKLGKETVAQITDALKDLTR